MLATSPIFVLMAEPTDDIKYRKYRKPKVRKRKKNK